MLLGQHLLAFQRESVPDEMLAYLNLQPVQPEELTSIPASLEDSAYLEAFEDRIISTKVSILVLSCPLSESL